MQEIDMTGEKLHFSSENIIKYFILSMCHDIFVWSIENSPLAYSLYLWWYFVIHLQWLYMYYTLVEDQIDALPYGNDE